MEISEMEYLALKAQVQTLQNQVDAINGPKKVTSLAGLIKEQAIGHVKM